MARILMQIPEGFDTNEISEKQEELYSILYETAKEDIYNELEDPDVYVCDLDMLSVDDCIFGALKPELLMKTVLNWNSKIEKNLRSAISSFQNSNANLGNAITYGLKVAAIAADNCFYAYAEDIVDLMYESKYHMLKSIISDKDLAEILNAPESFAIIPIYIK